MRRKRHSYTPNMVKGSSIGNGTAAPSVDLSGATRCSALLEIASPPGVQVEVETQISPDDFDVPDSSATWFNYFGARHANSSGNEESHRNVLIEEHTALQMPQSGDGYNDYVNSNNRCGRRMRIATTDTTAYQNGRIDSCVYSYAADILGARRETQIQQLAAFDAPTSGASGWTSEPFDISCASSAHVYYQIVTPTVGSNGFRYRMEVSADPMEDVSSTFYPIPDQIVSVNTNAVRPYREVQTFPMYTYSEGFLSFSKARLAQVGATTANDVEVNLWVETSAVRG